MEKQSNPCYGTLRSHRPFIPARESLQTLSVDAGPTNRKPASGTGGKRIKGKGAGNLLKAPGTYGKGSPQ